MDLVEEVFRMYLSLDSKKEVTFMGDFLNMPLPMPKSDADSEDWYRDASELAERAGNLHGFNNFYAALKGLFLFWMDYKALDIMKRTDTPNLYRDRLFARMDMYRAMRAEKTEILREIERRCAGYAERYAKYRESGGNLGGGVSFETKAFFRVLAEARGAPRVWDWVSDAERVRQSGRTKKYLGGCRNAIFGWLGRLCIKPDAGAGPT